MHRRIHVTEIPLIGRHLTIGVEIAFIQHQLQLVFGEVEIDAGKRNGVKRQIPCRIPGILPFVRHGDDVGVHHIEPVFVADRGMLQAGAIGETVLV